MKKRRARGGLGDESYQNINYDDDDDDDDEFENKLNQLLTVR